MRTFGFALKDVNALKFCEDSSSCLCFPARTHMPSRCPDPETYLRVRLLSRNFLHVRAGEYWAWFSLFSQRLFRRYLPGLCDILCLEKNGFHILCYMKTHSCLSPTNILWYAMYFTYNDSFIIVSWPCGLYIQIPVWHPAELSVTDFFNHTLTIHWLLPSLLSRTIGFHRLSRYFIVTLSLVLLWSFVFFWTFPFH